MPNHVDNDPDDPIEFVPTPFFALLEDPDQGWGAPKAPDDVANALEAEAFESEGWKFFEANSAFLAGWKANQDRTSSETLGRVFKLGDRTLIETPRIRVRFENDTRKNRIQGELDRLDLQWVRECAGPKELVVASVGDRSACQVAEYLNGPAEESVAWAEPIWLEVLVANHRPTDPKYAQQWHLNRTGAEHAWDSTRGAGTRIAIVDWGFDADHVDLVDGVCPESSVRDPITGVWSIGPGGIPDADHGTRCAGVAGARQGNRRGGSGVAPEADLLLISLVSALVTGTSISSLIVESNVIAEGFAHAVGMGYGNDESSIYLGADVISCSLGHDGMSVVTPYMGEVLDYCWNDARNGLGVPIFWAVGNSNTYKVPDDRIARDWRTIAVGSLKTLEERWSHAWGRGLDFLAPGRNIWTTNTDDEYIEADGTSMATPYAAAVGALVLSINYGFTAREVRRILRVTCEKVGLKLSNPAARPHYSHRTEWDKKYGFGRVSPGGAVSRAIWLRDTGFPA